MKSLLREKLFLFTAPAIATRETPIIRVVLAVTEPTALPIASCAEPFIAALTETKSSGRVVAKETTDSNGKIKVDLVYGTYIVKQLTSTANYEKVDDFVIKVEEIGEPIYKVIANANIKAKLKVIKKI